MTLSAIIGLFVGLYFARNRVQRVMLLAHHLPYRFWRSYAELYDVAESRFTYEMIGRPARETLSDFLRRYDASRPHAASHFRAVWDTLALQVGRDYILAFLVPLGVFWHDYASFALVFLLTQVARACYIHFYKHHDLDLFALLMVQIILGRAPISNVRPKAR